MPRPAGILLDNRRPGCKLSLAQSSRANLPHCRLGRLSESVSVLSTSEEERSNEIAASGRSSEVEGARLRNLSSIEAVRAAFGGELLNETSRDSLSPGRFFSLTRLADREVQYRADRADRYGFRSDGKPRGHRTYGAVTIPSARTASAESARRRTALRGIYRAVSPESRPIEIVSTMRAQILPARLPPVRTEGFEPSD